jgi:hypothetical protein
MELKEKLQPLLEARSVLDQELDSALDEKARVLGFTQAIKASILHISKIIKNTQDQHNAEEERKQKAQKGRDAARKNRKPASKKSTSA